MSKDLLGRYIWIVDTIKRFGCITMRQLADRWALSPYGQEGQRLSRRTFYNYRQAIAEVFQVQIECRPDTFEYYIAPGSAASESVTGWLLNTASMSEVIAGAGDLQGRIFVEDVPSARLHLRAVVSALRDSCTLKFDYHPYTRVLPSRDIRLQPYFLKLFRQRWYVTGMNVRDRKLKTYALDRMSNVISVADSHFDLPAGFNPEEYMRHSFGIVFDEGEPRRITIRTDARLAKYLRALPLHPTQEENIHDDYSIFNYHMKLTHDLVEELLSHGSRLTVLGPAELRAMMKAELKDALAGYDA